MARVRRLLLLALLTVAILAVGCTSTGDTTGTSGTTVPSDGLVDIGSGLRGVSGLHASVYATGMANLSAFAFDSQGRLWAATADFSDTGGDAVYLIPSTGAAQPVKVIADAHTPLGLLWYHEPGGDTLYVASKERVEAYRDLSGTTFATSTVIVQLPAGVGEVNGLAMGPDGRIRLGISSPCDSCVPTMPDSAAVVSFLPDGSDLQVVATGIRAPVGLAYHPGTSDLFVTMNQRDDLGDKTPGDWLSVVRDGQAWGFPACYGQGGADCAGAPAPVAELDAHAAVAGVTIVTGQLGPTVGDAAIVAEWVTGKVLRVGLTKRGDTYQGRVSPFIAGIEKPEPVTLGPDGALYVGDWKSGTAYRISS